MKKFYSLLLAAALAFRPVVVTLGCLLSYFILFTALVGVILFLGFGIFSVWSFFINLIFGKP